jgi:hypothetical protein
VKSKERNVSAHFIGIHITQFNPNRLRLPSLHGSTLTPLLHAYNTLNKIDFFTLKRADSDDGKKICREDGDFERGVKRRRRV